MKQKTSLLIALFATLLQMTNKTSFIIFFVLLGYSTTYSQTVNDKPISEIDVEYVQIIGSTQRVRSQMSIQIDFGQENKLFDLKDTRIKDINGKPMVFNSMMDALNFMSKNGYDFINAHTVTAGKHHVVYHYVLKKRK